MKRIVLFAVIVGLAGVTSCRAKRGCPSNGKNVGAEKILSGDPASMKALKKAGKFRS